MVTPNKDALPEDPEAQRAIKDLLDRLNPADSVAMDFICRAGAWLDSAQQHQSAELGSASLASVLPVANILAELSLDHESIVTALVYKVAKTSPPALREIERTFGARIASLVRGLMQMAALPDTLGTTSFSQKPSQGEGLRKMFLAMASDPRVVVIKLAEQLHKLRMLHSQPRELRERFACQAIEIFAPLANRLGMWQLKWELEDLAFRCLEPKAYKDLARQLAERRIDRERYIERFIDTLQIELQHAGVDATITGRPKHIYGIWRKMQRSGQGFQQIYDKRAVRILVQKVSDCYTVLATVHARWLYLPDQFDDYIAVPKANNYRSIHTAIIGPEDQVVEVQIRTQEMHQQAELGIAAHWQYKDRLAPDPSFDLRIAWLRQLLQWRAESVASGDWLDRFRSDLFQDRVYVLTPKGTVLDLPQGATPLDFAYQIHTQVGHRCRGAKVNGRIVPLNYRLHNGIQVEILTAKHGGPSRDWSSIQLGYLKTAKARAKVQQWFRQLDYARNVADGRASLERELKRLGCAKVNQEKLAQALGYKRTDDFFAAIGRGDFKASRINNIIRDRLGYDRAAETLSAATKVATASKSPVTSRVRVEDVGNLVTRLAKCCHPLPGDRILGYVTRGYGVSIHRHNCYKVQACASACPERIAAASWDIDANGSYPVHIRIIAFHRERLLRDVTTVIIEEKLPITATDTYVNKSTQTETILATFEVPSMTALNRVIARIRKIPEIFEVQRTNR